MSEELREETPAEEALRSLACWLGVGGYNATTVDAKAFEEKIREGVMLYSQTHGFVARDLAEVVMSMGLVTPKGLRAKQLARRILGISAADATQAAESPVEGATGADWTQVGTLTVAEDGSREVDWHRAKLGWLARNGGKAALYIKDASPSPSSPRPE